MMWIGNVGICIDNLEYSESLKDEYTDLNRSFIEIKNALKDDDEIKKFEGYINKFSKLYYTNSE